MSIPLSDFFVLPEWVTVVVAVPMAIYVCLCCVDRIMLLVGRWRRDARYADYRAMARYGWVHGRRFSRRTFRKPIDETPAKDRLTSYCRMFLCYLAAIPYGAYFLLTGLLLCLNFPEGEPLLVLGSVLTLIGCGLFSRALMVAGHRQFISLFPKLNRLKN